MEKEPVNDYRIVRLSVEMLGDVRSLYRSTYNLKTETDHLLQKYDTSFTEKKYIGFIAYSKDNTPAAYYGVFPCFIQYQNEKILAAQSGDTMTDPKHQGKGLFTLLAKMTYELAEKEGVKLVFGFPNKNSYPGFVKKLNWVHKENMRTYSFKISTLPLIKAAKKFSLLDLYQAYAKNILGKYISNKKYIANSSIDPEYGGILHDEAFFQYKTYSGNFILETEGVSMWLKLDGKLWIGDVERTSLEKFNKALRKLQNLCFYIGCTEISFNVSPSSYWDSLLSPTNNYSEGLPIGYLDMGSNIDLKKINFTGGDFDTF